MTANDLQRIAVRLSNQSWCRHWLNYGDRHTDVQMAIQCRDSYGNPTEIKCLLELNFVEQPDHIYVINRTEEDGSPFVSKIF